MHDCQKHSNNGPRVVVNYASQGPRSRLDGVRSAHEVALIKGMPLHQTLSSVTPGTRPAGAEIGDQKRVMTPQEAHKN